jgi:MSHA pilin protein MshD
MSMTNPPRLPLIRGFTLIEIVITIVILGAVAGILVPFFNAIVHSPDPVIRERAISLGQAMMDEIMAKRWDENTPMGGGPICTGESSSQATRTSLLYLCTARATDPVNWWDTPVAGLGMDGGEIRIDFDDVDDYNGYKEEKNDPKLDQNDNQFLLPGYSRTVSVSYIPSNTPSIDQNTTAAGTTTDTKLVVVTIISPLNETFYFVAVACNI